MSTPSKKLNDFLRANGKAVGQALREQLAEQEIPADRELSPEAKAAVDAALANLKRAQRGITTEMVGSLPVNRAFDKGWNPHE